MNHKGPWPPAPALELRPGDRHKLKALAQDQNSAKHLVLRACILLLCADGVSHNEVCRRLHTSKDRVLYWRRRYEQSGISSLRGQSPPPSPPLVLQSGDREKLEAIVQDSHSSRHLLLRARIVLLCADGVSHREIQRRLHTSPDHVLRWRRRYEQSGLSILCDRRRDSTPALGLQPGDQARLKALVKESGISRRVALQAQIILLCCEGRPHVEIADRLGTSTKSTATTGWGPKDARSDSPETHHLAHTGTARMHNPVLRGWTLRLGNRESTWRSEEHRTPLATAL